MQRIRALLQTGNHDGGMVIFIIECCCFPEGTTPADGTPLHAAPTV